MHPLDHEIASALAETAAPRLGPARILVVGGPRVQREVLSTWLTERNHTCLAVRCFDDARAAIARKRFDLVLLGAQDEQGDDTNVLSLIPLVLKTSPATKTMVFSLRPGFETAVAAMRCGAVDFLCLPMNREELAARVDTALIKSRLDQQRDERLGRLKKICKELNTVRHEITQQVDSLCQDLVTAYQDVNEQLNEVAMAAEFRALLNQELDVEDLLRTALEYVLTKTGPTNAAVFLPGGDGAYSLGAYVNYDCPRESVAVLLEHLCDAVCPQMAGETEIVWFEDSSEFAQWIGTEASFITDSQVVAFPCRHQGACLAVVVLFRKASDPYKDDLAGVIGALRPIFAAQLSQVIRVHHRANPSWPKDRHENDDADGTGDDDDIIDDFSDNAPGTGPGHKPDGGDEEDDYGFGLAA